MSSDVPGRLSDVESVAAPIHADRTADAILFIGPLRVVSILDRLRQRRHQMRRRRLVRTAWAAKSHSALAICRKLRSIAKHLREEAIVGLFDGLLGGSVGAGMVSVVSGIIEKHGGLQGVVNEFEQKGLGVTVKSWVSTGPNQPISPDEVHKVLGPDLLQQLSQKSGLSVDDLAQKLSQVLPQAVDKLTPDGSIPTS